MKIKDIMRSHLQFKKHQELNYLKLTSIHKFILSFMWFFLLPTTILEFILKKKKNHKDVFVLEYTDKEPYRTIYDRLKLDTNYRFVALSRYYVPYLPWIFVKDLGILLREKPLFFIKNLDFLGALALKASHYNSLIQKQGIQNLIVLQEYSFYSSYLTRILEYENGKLYNIQHGVPGETYCFFRFSKCFIWGEHYRKEYIRNGAEESQFVVVGSLFHDSIDSEKKKYKESIDILYVMQGYVGSKEDTLMILDLLESLSSEHKIRILQHPRHRVVVAHNLLEYNGNIAEAILSSTVILSRFSTAMLDALYLKRHAVAYIGKNKSLRRYVGYLPKNLVTETVVDLEKNLLKLLVENKVAILDNNFIDQTKNPIRKIDDEICKNSTL